LNNTYSIYLGASLEQNKLLADAIVLSPLGDYNTLAYLPHKDIVVPPATAKTLPLLEAFKYPASIKPSAQVCM
jgi:hypothetical protein